MWTGRNNRTSKLQRNAIGVIDAVRQNSSSQFSRPKRRSTVRLTDYRIRDTPGASVTRQSNMTDHTHIVCRVRLGEVITRSDADDRAVAQRNS